MNEKELINQTIQTIKRDGWTTCIMGPGRHCILGSIGKARWGEQWDEDCMSGAGNVYVLLQADPTTAAVVARIAEIITTRSEHWATYAQNTFHIKKEITKQDQQYIAYSWNDAEADTQSVLSVLEEAKAQLG